MPEVSATFQREVWAQQHGWGWRSWSLVASLAMGVQYLPGPGFWAEDFPNFCVCSCGGQVWKHRWWPQMLCKDLFFLCTCLKLHSWSSGVLLLLFSVCSSWCICPLIHMFFILLRQGLKISNSAHFLSRGALWGQAPLPFTLFQRCTFPYEGNCSSLKPQGWQKLAGCPHRVSPSTGLSPPAEPWQGPYGYTLVPSGAGAELQPRTHHAWLVCALGLGHPHQAQG